jgi:hypothetical protein
MIHYYRLIFHYHHFHCHSDKSDDVILPPPVGPIVRPPAEGNWQLNFYHRWVNNRWGSGIFSVVWKAKLMWVISQLPTTQLHHHYLHFSIVKVGLFSQGLDALLGLNPHTLDSTHWWATISFLIAKKCFVFILAPLMASPHWVFGEGLQD